MSRVIKFRAWDASRNEMVTGGFAVQTNGDTFITTGKSPAQLILMQFTGLLDSKGKEIYEGDILHLTHEGDEYIRSVEWKGNNYPAFDFNKEIYDDSVNELSLFTADGEMSVIGNIYENPNLLKV